VNDVADATLYPTANSWYLGANIPGKTRVFMPYVAGVDTYRKECDDVVRGDYLGFRRITIQRDESPTPDTSAIA
jgi:hypothetical protein